MSFLSAKQGEWRPVMSKHVEWTQATNVDVHRSPKTPGSARSGAGLQPRRRVVQAVRVEVRNPRYTPMSYRFFCTSTMDKRHVLQITLKGVLTVRGTEEDRPP